VRAVWSVANDNDEGGMPPPIFLRGSVMLYWALIFFIVAIIAAIFGFGGIAAGAADIARILFIIFLVLFVISLIAGLVRRGGTV
jgi:uncharacterized membrane protein YtjA (UPF0391 family)